MLRELDNRKDYLPDEPVTTIYIGGGTPSMLSSHNLSRLCFSLKDFAGESLEEFTVECNPDDITPELASLLYSLGVNRVSMGAQTFSDERLAFIHRRHKAYQVKEAVENLRNVGIRNISIDLMFGFPDETVDNWKCDIEQALSLGVQHISAYSLMYEEGTPLYKLLEEGKIKEISEDVSLEMYETLITLLTQAGYEHYEISNFALLGYRSKHNSSYWKRVPYLGIGAAAHSYNLTSRQWNVSDVKLYIKGDNIIEDCELLDNIEQYNDLITTALRTREGIDIDSLSETDKLFLTKAANKSIEQGNLIIENNHLHLTRKGLFISDAVMVELIR
jgi:oxygen-independent coproporphyrinogen-3 oxidase